MVVEFTKNGVLTFKGMKNSAITVNKPSNFDYATFEGDLPVEIAQYNINYEQLSVSGAPDNKWRVDDGSHRIMLIQDSLGGAIGFATGQNRGNYQGDYSVVLTRDPER